MMRLLLALVAALIFLTVSPAMAHRHRLAGNNVYGGWQGWSGYSHHNSSYFGRNHSPVPGYPLYPFYAAPAFGHGYRTGLPYPYYNNYYFGYGGAF